MHPMFKIEVFDALQTRFGPSNIIYLSQTHLSKRNPELQNKEVTGSPQSEYNLPVTRTNKCRALSNVTRNGVRWVILNSLHGTGNMYYINHA